VAEFIVSDPLTFSSQEVIGSVRPSSTGPQSDAHRPPEQVSPFALSIAGTVQATGGAVSRTRLFDLIRSGEVDARKVGRRTVVIAESLRAFLERQPQAAEVRRGGQP
jgi:hypothetical protein